MLSTVDSAVEVAVPRRGEVTTADLRAVYGADLQHMDHVDVLVLDADGGMPVAAKIALTLVRSGWSSRRAMVCPACHEACHLLLARGGALKCRRCHRHRTRRQRERSCVEWNRMGGEAEDRLHRLLLRPGLMTPGRLTAAQGLVQSLLAADRARVARFRTTLEALTVLVATRA